MHRQRREAESAAAREAELLSADPFDAESQRRIEELIQRQQIEENFAAVRTIGPGVVAGRLLTPAVHLAVWRAAQVPHSSVHDCTSLLAWPPHRHWSTTQSRLAQS